jgi:acyl carrier protein
MMKVTGRDILATFSTLIPKDVAEKMDPSKPMLAQGVDSLALTVMAVALQNTYQVDIGVEDGLKLKTMDDVAEFVNRKRS